MICHFIYQLDPLPSGSSGIHDISQFTDDLLLKFELRGKDGVSGKNSFIYTPHYTNGEFGEPVIYELVDPGDGSYYGFELSLFGEAGDIVFDFGYSPIAT